MADHDIAARQIYPVPCHQHPVYNEHRQANDDFPITSRLSKQLVSRPVHHGLTDVELNRIVRALGSY